MGRIFFWCMDFNPRSPCGERHWNILLTAFAEDISIHAPHAGSDRRQLNYFAFVFISIHAPHAGSDELVAAETWLNGISIHAPHAGSDAFTDAEWAELIDFNPRSPCGERPSFLFRSKQLPSISIHAPHAGSDTG